MNIVLFEDAAVPQLYPITLMRPAYAVTCGGLRLLDVARTMGDVFGIVRDFLVDFQADYNVQDVGARNGEMPTLWLNARLAPDAQALRVAIESQLSTSVCLLDGEHVVAAMTPAGSAVDVGNIGPASFANLPQVESKLRLFDYPHSIIDAMAGKTSSLMKDNLEFLQESGDYRELADGVFGAAGVTLPSNVVFETEAGPVLLEANSSVGAFSVIRGPVRIGEDTAVSPHALLKGPVCIGHTCKVGGEVSNSIIEPFSNKVHFGYLGTSYVGSWVNLGAGTTNSNLKNTYGTIRAEYDSGKVDTGMQFLGCVIGDYTKTAIHTGIYTGKILGACSNVYGTVTTNVPGFANYARSFGEVTEHPADVMLTTQKRVFARRGLEQEPRHVELIQAAYAIEAPKRKLANNPPSL